MIAGPSEIGILADSSAREDYLAIDLLSQAEHDEMASSILITPSQKLADEVKIEIEDNAGGINENYIDRVFEPYFSTKKEEEGTGIGLYMGKTIVNKHLHGSIEAKNIDNGVCFRIKIPK